MKAISELVLELKMTRQGFDVLLKRAQEAFPSDFKVSRKNVNGHSRVYIRDADAARLVEYRKFHVQKEPK